MISAIVQARLNSTRLPHKVLMELPNGNTVLEQVLENLSKCRLLDDIILTTPDAELTLFCEHYSLYTGERDVLKEFYIAAKTFKVDTIVRITADCPLIDPEIVDWMITEFNISDMDLVYNTECDISMRGDGLDVEVFSMDALKKAYNESTKREHVTDWMRENLRSKYIPAPEFEGCSIDTQEDYERICELMRRGK